MGNLPAHVYAFVIGFVGVIGIIVLAATSHPVPSILTTITVAAIAAGAGIAIPSSSGTTGGSSTFPPA